MKVVHFSSNDSRGGAMRSALRLHHGLLSLGVNSKMLVQDKNSDESSIIKVNNSCLSPLFKIIRDYYIQFQRTSLTNTFFSLGYSDISCVHEKIIQEADILVLHWVADFLSPAEIHNLLMLQKPLIWVCHDMRAFTGGCHYTAGCRQFTKVCKNCPQLKTDPFGVVEANFKDQQDLFSQTITVVAPSQWMLEEARASAIFSQNRIEKIPYGVETDVFFPGNKKEARSSLKIAADDFVILLACSNAKEERKGLSYIKEIFKKLSEDPRIKTQNFPASKILFLFIGQGTRSLPGFEFSAKHLGFVENDKKLCKIYRAADVLLHLSTEDNLPNMVIEAMSCGTPVISFRAGGVADIITHKKNGYLVSVGDLSQFSGIILNMMFHSVNRDRMGKIARATVKNKFTLGQQAKAHLKLYKELINKTRLNENDHLTEHSLRMAQIMPHLLSIAKSIMRFIEIERESCSKQLHALAALKADQKKTYPEYHYFIDFPQHSINKIYCEAKGWVFHREGIPIQGVRFKIKDKIFNGTVGHSRPDVAHYYNNASGSTKSGIVIPVEFKRGINQLIIEVLVNDRWEEIGFIQVKCNPFWFLMLVFLKKISKILNNIIFKANFLKPQSEQRVLKIFKEKVKFEIFKLLKKLKEEILNKIHSCFRNKKISGLGHLNHYAPRPIKYEKYPSQCGSRCYKISIVTPSFNQGSFLEKTMQSVLTQKYNNLEYVVIDGASQDSSPRIIQKYKSLLKYGVSEPDLGQSDAIQKGFQYCSGSKDEIMAYLNSDDLLLPGALDFVNSYFQEHPEVDLIYGHRILIDDEGYEIGRWFTPHHNDYNLSILDYVPQETMFWRRRLYHKIGGIDPNFHFAMDWDFLLRAQKSEAIIKRVPYFLGCFRVHEQQKTSAHMNTIGQEEIKKLQFRSHQRIISDDEMAKVHMKNVIESTLTQILFSIKIRF